ncbi:MAG: hypothetical protein IH921_10345, partial [Gemmatimonadetes bacterium]|nr:hypothetical protein [Gemmatimonadota bacterium]
TIDDLIDFTPELRAQAEEVVAGMTIGPLYTPQTVLDDEGKRGTLMTPGSTAVPTGRVARSIPRPACSTWRRSPTLPGCR